MLELPGAATCNEMEKNEEKLKYYFVYGDFRLQLASLRVP